MRESRSAQAAALLVTLLVIRSTPEGAPPPPPCDRPLEVASRDGHTRVVACVCDGGPLRGPARRLFGLPIDVNVADAWTLEALPGIGPARARAIVAERQRAPFARVSDLLRVHGIGPVTLARIAPELSAEPVSNKTGSLPMETPGPAACATSPGARGETQRDSQAG